MDLFQFSFTYASYLPFPYLKYINENKFAQIFFGEKGRIDYSVIAIISV